ncbi:CHAD domain-containing protein [Ruegeria sp.]|uniref:CHAD domain-containing protein n=1 Tax=Ruegeria sp. TaxID=1879320 RepID=UPI003C7C53F7
MTRKLNGFLVLNGAIDALDISRLPKGLTGQVEVERTSKAFRILDCHDQSLSSCGRILIESGGMLRLFQEDGQVCVQRAAGKGRFVQELPDGPVRAALSDFPRLRALIEVGAGVFEQNAIVILDDLQKTVVRGVAITLTSDARQVTLVQLERLRGYGGEFEKSCAALSLNCVKNADLGAVFTLLFPDQKVYQAKPSVQLGKNEPAIQAATDIIRTFLDVARQNEAGVVADIDTEFLHDYRISLRRVRSVLSLFKGVYSDDLTARLKRIFSDHMAPTGRLRDLDVHLLEKDNYFSLVPQSLHAGLEEMFSRFETERRKERAKLSRRFRSASYKHAMQALSEEFQDHRNLEAGPTAETGAYDYARALIWKRYRKVCKLARSISRETPDDVVHELRIHCKKLRYLMEFFAPLFDKAAFKIIIKPLKKLQDNLGNFNDCSVQQEALLDLINQTTTRAGQTNGQLAMAAGGLIAVLSQRQQAERDRVVANFEHFDSPKIRRLFQSLFHASED